jgi:rubrerythrin
VRDARRRLARLLVAAYSGEQAAALAYRGHWRSVSDADERVRIRQIEDDEWRHRLILARVLGRLGAAPSPLKELRTLLLGRALGALCHAAGWLLPMYAAGLLERSNVCNYDEAAGLAGEAGLPELVDELREMAAVERDHERFFRDKAAAHPAGRWLRALRGTARGGADAPTPALGCREARR